MGEDYILKTINDETKEEEQEIYQLERIDLENIHTKTAQGQEVLYKIAKKIAHTNPALLCKIFREFEIQSEDRRLELAMICAKQDPEVFLWYIIHSTIKNVMGRIMLAETIKSLSNFRANVHELRSFNIECGSYYTWKESVENLVTNKHFTKEEAMWEVYKQSKLVQTQEITG